jgi:hypothetical protein
VSLLQAEVGDSGAAAEFLAALGNQRGTLMARAGVFALFMSVVAFAERLNQASHAVMYTDGQQRVRLDISESQI